MNNELQKLYLSCLDDFKIFSDDNKKLDLCGPLCIKVGGYAQQKTKLMIVGQETYGWCNSLTLGEQLDTYEEFNFGSAYVSSPFWNITRKLERALRVDPYAIAWSNINRFDCGGSSPDGTAIEETIRSFDFILKEEIEILAPDACVLFTNRKYDNRLSDLFIGLVFADIDNLPASHFARLHHPSLPAFTIRAPHPKTIRMMSWENDFIEYIKKASQL